MIDEVEIDVDEFISRIRGNKPPFTCPFEKCSKLCKSFSAIQKHMTMMHKNTKEIEICEIDVVNDENKNSQAAYAENSSPGINMKQTSKLISDAVQLSYADSKKFVILQNDRRSFRCNVNVPIFVSTYTADLNTSVISEINTNTVQDENSNDTSQSDLSNIIRKSCKKRRLLSLKTIRKFRKLNNGEKDNSANNVSICIPEENHAEVLKPIITPVPVFTSDKSLEIFKKQIPHDNDNYVQHIEKSLEELNKIVEYDLDEEDLLWLPRCNDYLMSLDNECSETQQDRRYSSKFKNDTIERTAMEYVMDRFEKECHFESKSGNNAHIDVDEDAVCDVCMDGTCDNSNVILFCDVCNLAVHQECYGVPYVPEGQWLCRKCFHSPSHPVECCLCPNKGGAFKQTDDGRWAHVVCGLWVPEVMFANLIFLEPIENIEKIELARWRLTCYLCKQKNVGACIQCHKSNCYVAFHVTCAQQAGLYMKIEQNDRSTGATGIRKSAFCDMHTPVGYTAGVHRGMYATSDDEISPEKSYKRQKKLKDVRKLLTQRRNINPPICYPVIPQDKLKEICSKIDVKHKEEFISRIHAYWKLKREYKRGVPLLRRLVASSSKATLSMIPFDEGSNEMISNLKFWQQLRQDLEKARLLSELGKKREKLKREIFRNFVAINDVLLHPTTYLMKSLIDQLQLLDKKKIFSEPVTDDIAPSYSRIIQKPMHFALMRKKLTFHEYINIEDIFEDFELMLNNCRKYNGKNTFYYNSAQKLNTQALPIFDEYKQKFADFDIDRQSGLFINKNIYNLTINNLDDENIVSKLETEISKKVEDIALDTQEIEIQCQHQFPKKSLDSQSSRKDESYTIKTRRQSQESTETNTPPPKITSDIHMSFDKLTISQQNSILKRMPATSSININSISSTSRRRSTTLTGHKKLSNVKVSSTHTDPDSTYDIMVNKSKYKQRSSSEDRGKSFHFEDDDDSSNHNSYNPQESSNQSEEEDHFGKSDFKFKSLDLVWAKCRGFPWFPGMIIDPSKKRTETINSIGPIPVPPDRVLELRRSQNVQYKYLILFFDKKRTWQWLEKEKLKPFAVTEDIDGNMFEIIRKCRRNKTIQRAYKEAVYHLCQVNGIRYPYEDEDTDDELTSPFIIPKYKY